MKKKLSTLVFVSILVTLFLLAFGFAKINALRRSQDGPKDSLSVLNKLFISSSTQIYDDDDDKEEGLPANWKLMAALDAIDDGYTDRHSYNPGDTVHVFASASAVYNNKKIYLYDIALSKIDSLTTSFFHQTMSSVQPWLNYGYSETFKYIIPASLKSGVYNFGNRIFFIVKSKAKNADITIVYPTNTEAAYNNQGGKSLYDFNSGNQRVKTVTFRRPLSPYILNEIQCHSRPFLKWLLSYNAHSIQFIADQDMDDYPEIMKSKLLVVIGHSEYWSYQGRKNFDKFVDEGKDAVVFSGNTMWWQVRYSSDKTQLICYKDSASDPEPNPLLKTIEWPRASLNYPPLKSIGCDFPHGAYGMYQSYHGNYGYKILLPNSPLLQGTNLSYHNILACQSYEYDATLFNGFLSNGDPVLDTSTLGFCKIELIGYDYGERTSNTSPMQSGYGTFIVFKKNPSSGITVNTGFNTFTGKTPSYGSGGITGSDSLKVRRIVLNIFDKLLNKQNVFANPSPGCTDVYAGIKTNQEQEITCTLFPNPAKGNLKVDLKGEYQEYVFSFYNSEGKKLLTTLIESNQVNEIDVSKFHAGPYFYVISSKDLKAIKSGKVVLVE